MKNKIINTIAILLLAGWGIFFIYPYLEGSYMFSILYRTQIKDLAFLERLHAEALKTNNLFILLHDCKLQTQARHSKELTETLNQIDKFIKDYRDTGYYKVVAKLLKPEPDHKKALKLAQDYCKHDRYHRRNMALTARLAALDNNDAELLTQIFYTFRRILTKQRHIEHNDISKLVLNIDNSVPIYKIIFKPDKINVKLNTKFIVELKEYISKNRKKHELKAHFQKWLNEITDKTSLARNILFKFCKWGVNPAYYDKTWEKVTYKIK